MMRVRRKNRKILSVRFVALVLFLSSVPVSSAWSEPLASVKAFADKSEITIGDQVRYTVQVELPADATADFPPPEAYLAGFAIKDFGVEKPVKAGRDRTRLGRWYALDTYTVGSYVIPQQEVTIRFADGSTNTLKSPEVFVEVRSVLAQDGIEAGLKDIKQPLAVPDPFTPAVIMGVLVGFLLVAGVIAGWIFYRKKILDGVTAPPAPPHTRAFQELERIAQMNLLSKNETKEYYYLVSNCLRTYLERRFNLRATEQTSEEFFESKALGDVLEGRYINLLKEYLRRCDLVKYAKMDPDTEERDHLMETTKKFIMETAPQEITQEFPATEEAAP